MGDFARLLLEHLHSWWPIRIIDAGCQGVKYMQDGSVRCLAPGWHLFVPKLQRVEEVACQTQSADCGLQSLTTQDGKEITISINVTYSILNAALLWTSFQHFDTTLVNLARGHAAEILCQESWTELLADPAAVSQEIQETLIEELSPFGVTIEDVTMDQVSRVKALRLLSSTSVL